MDLSFVTVAFVWDEELQRFSAYIPDIAAYGEGTTKGDALEDLKKALALYIEEVGRDGFMSEIVEPVEYEKLELSQLV